MPSLVKVDPVVLEGKIFNVVDVSKYASKYELHKAMAMNLDKRLSFYMVKS